MVAQSSALLESSYDEFAHGDIFKVKKWTNVFTWEWDVRADTCAICRIDLIEPCLKVGNLKISHFKCGLTTKMALDALQ